MSPLIHRHGPLDPAARAAARLALVLLVAAAASGCGGGGKSSEISVGGYMGLTGNVATFGQSTKNAIVMAVDEINAAGGIDGRKIKMTIEDDQSRPEEAATVVRKLISQDGVIAVIGDIPSSNSLAAAPICQEAGVPMITPSSTNPKVTETGDYIFRVCFIDPFQGTVMARFAYEHQGVRKAAILRDIRSDYSVGLADFFIQTFTRLGGQITGDQSYSQGDTDFRPQLTALKAQNPEAIFIPGYYNDVGLIIRQARELGITVPLLGGDGWDSPDLFKLAGAGVKNTFFSNHYSADDQSPAVQNFVQSFAARYGNKPDGLAALGYDATQVLATGLRQLVADDPAAFEHLTGPAPAGGEARAARAHARALLRDRLAQVKDFPGVTGRISIDGNRNAVKSAVVLAVERDGYTYVTTIEP